MGLYIDDLGGEQLTLEALNENVSGSNHGRTNLGKEVFSIGLDLLRTHVLGNAPE